MPCDDSAYEKRRRTQRVRRGFSEVLVRKDMVQIADENRLV